MEKQKSTDMIILKDLWPLLIPILLLLPGLAAFPYPSANAPYSDISITHYPNAIFLKLSVLELGQIPLWSSSILSGFPFAANPLSGLWYPPGWLALLFSLPLGFNLVIIFHLLVGSLGMYLLIRALGRSHQASLFGALAFELLPKVFAHYGAGHLTMIYAISWTPWLLLAEIRNSRDSGIHWLQQPGIFLALIALADIRWSLYAGIFWMAFSFWVSPIPIKHWLVSNIKQVLLATALAAPLLLPLIEYSQLSTRANLSANDLLAFSLSPAGLIGLLAPQFGGLHEWVLYVGIVAFSLAIFRIASRHKDRLDIFLLIAAAVALIFSLGEHVPVLSQITQLPLLSLLRVPPRILPIAAISLILLAAGSMDALNSKQDQELWRRINLVLFGFLGLLIGLAIAISIQSHIVPITYVWALTIVLAFSIMVWLFSAKRLSYAWFSFGVLALTVVDLSLVDSTLFSPRSKETVLDEGSAVAGFLAEQPRLFRVYSPSYSIPQQTAAEFGLELADGVDPLQLQAYVDFMEDATGVPSNGYSITLPPFSNGDPANDNRNAKPDLNRLALLNVNYLVSEFDLDLEGLEIVDEFEGPNVYKLSGSLPRVYMLDAEDQAATITRWTPNRIVIEAGGPGRLVLSELDYPGWVAFVDGERVAIEPHEGIFRSVVLQEGAHQVTFEFRPLSVYLGILLCLSAVFFLSLSSRLRKK